MDFNIVEIHAQQICITNHNYNNWSEKVDVSGDQTCIISPSQEIFI